MNRKKRSAVSMNPRDRARLKKLAAHWDMPEAAAVSHMINFHADLAGLRVSQAEIDAAIPKHRPPWEAEADDALATIDRIDQARRAFE